MQDTFMFETAYFGSYYTIIGVNDYEDFKRGYTRELQDCGIGTPQKFIEFTGKEMNEHYHLTGDNRYKDDLHFLAFSLDGLDVAKLSLFRLLWDDKWFDDMVDNNSRREREKGNAYYR
jgi:hypothetical protein